jgi:hypothetical protein
MKKEYLQNYERNEIVLQHEYYKRILGQNSESTFLTGYPPSWRFKKVNEPIVVCDERVYNQYGEKIWSQIPFAGTLVIPLGVSTRANFLKLHSFEVNEIPELVQLSKETGRIQFTLNTNPTHYEGMDYLDPNIFRTKYSG